MHEIRHRRAVTLVPTVRPVAGGYRVASATRNADYLVTQPNGHLMCTCPDFQHHQGEPGFKCKHALAVAMVLKENPHPQAGNGHAPAAASEPSQVSVLHRYLPGEDPVRLKLIKNTKGYSWEIAVSEPTAAGALALLQQVEQQVRAAFGKSQSEA